MAYSPEVERICREAHGTRENPFRASLHYLASADLRPFGISAILHTTCRHGDGDHKLELLDTGQMSYAAMLGEVERVYRVDARGLDVMRIDLCADVEGVPVPWFHQHVRVKWKRWGREHGKLEVARMGNVELQTAYYGRRPNCIRVYDKVAEWRKEYAARRRGAGETEFPAFEAIYGWPESGRILTRVERQIAGGRVPAAIRRLGAMPKVLPSFNPFEAVELAPEGNAALPDPDTCDGIEAWLAGVGLRALAADWGIQRTRAFLNRHGHRNGGRVLSKYARFLPAGTGISAARLFEIYQGSVERQLRAA